MREWDHFLAIDWSGAKGERHKGIALALATKAGEAPVLVAPPKGGFSRTDVLEILRVLSEMKDGRGDIDDIDNLGNRRVRSVGELLENQYRVGLLRMERAVKERMSSVDVSTVMPNDLINAKPAVAT